MKSGSVTDSMVARFMKKTAVSGECLMWTGFKAPSGYGYFMVWGQSWRSHRVAWILAHGSIPQGMHVLHKCDNPACVKLDHLFLGTHALNMNDMAQKGRSRPQKGQAASALPENVAKRRGSKNGASKLTESQVQALREEYANGGMNQKEVARKFSISHSLANQIINRVVWTHI